MKLILTGATGFLGRNLAEHFHDDGMQVVATGRSLKVGDELQQQGVEFRSADILDLNKLNKAFSSANSVIHCAARSGPWGRYREFYANNVVGTRNVVSACRNHGIKKMIFVSTPSVYFTGEDRYDISESEPLPERQASHYAKTKLTSETELLALQQEGFKVIIFRPRALFGPYDNTFVPRILRLAEKKKIPLVNDGQALIDITYVDDFVDAVQKALFAPDDAWNEVYNISNGDPISVREWFEQVLRIFDRPFRPKNVPEPAAKIVAAMMEFVSYFPLVNREPPMTRFSVGYMARSMTLNIDKAKQKLGYSPRVSNQEGFERYAQWYHAYRQKGGES